MGGTFSPQLRYGQRNDFFSIVRRQFPERTIWFGQEGIFPEDFFPVRTSCSKASPTIRWAISRENSPSW